MKSTTIVKFRGHMRPDAMDRIADRETQRTRAAHDDDREHMEALEGSEWAFIWAALTIAAIGFAVIVGAAWRAWPWF